MRSINSVKRMDNAVTESLTYPAMKASRAGDPARTLDREHITDVFKEQRKPTTEMTNLRLLNLTLTRSDRG